MTDTLSAINIEQLTSSAMNAFTGSVNIEPVSTSNATNPLSSSVQNLTPSSSNQPNRVVLPPISLIKKIHVKSQLQPIAPKTTTAMDVNKCVSTSATPGMQVFGSIQQGPAGQVAGILNLQQHQVNSGHVIGMLNQSEMLHDSPIPLHIGPQVSAGSAPGQQESLSSNHYPSTLHVCEHLSSNSNSENLNTGASKHESNVQTVAILNGCHVVSADQYGSHSLINGSYDNQRSLHPASVAESSLLGKGQQGISSINGSALNGSINSTLPMNSEPKNNTIAVQQMRDSHMVTSITEQLSDINHIQENVHDKESTQLSAPENQTLSQAQLISFSTTDNSSAGINQYSVSHILTPFNGSAALQDNLSSCYSRSVPNHSSLVSNSLNETIHLGSLGNPENHQSSNTEGLNLGINETLPNAQPIDLSNINVTVQDAVAIQLSNQDLHMVDTLVENHQAIVQELYLTRPPPDSNSASINQTNTEQNMNHLQEDTVQVDERAIRSIQDYLTIQNIQAYMAESDDNIIQAEAILQDQLSLKTNGITTDKDTQGINRKVLESVLKIIGRQQQQTPTIVTETTPASQSASSLDTATVQSFHQSTPTIITGSLSADQSVPSLHNTSDVPLHQTTQGMVENVISGQAVVNLPRINMPDSTGLKTSPNIATNIFTHYCIECRMSLMEPCQYHNTQSHTHILDSQILPYSQLSLPCVLYLRQSSTSTLEHSYGVWARTKISPYTKFGPMIGKFVNSEIQEKSKGYFPIWKIFQEEKCDEISMTDESVCNWLMYLRPARSENTQNILTHQIGTQIYFYTIKELLPEEELLFWYSKEYAKVLGVPASPNHMKINECLLCGKLFRSKKFLTMHEREVHPNENPKRFHCEVCNQRFTSLAKLNIHVSSHTGVKPHACGICGKRFNDPSNLRAHTAIHTGIKGFVCTTCGKGFRQKAHLQAHAIIHTGKKSFYCEFCGKYFARQSDLKTHSYSHTQEKAYICPYCNKSFYKSQNYKRHMFVHSGERNFICDLCSKTFYTKYHRNRHSKTCKGPGNGFVVSDNKDITVNNGDNDDWTSSTGHVATIKDSGTRKTGGKNLK